MKAFIRNLVADGYKLVSVIAPLLSVGFTLAKLVVGDALGEWFANLSIAWGLLPLVIWLLVAYVRRHAAYMKLEEATKPKIIYRWRFQTPYAELMLTNVSSKTVVGIDPILRNHRTPDDTQVSDVLRSLPPAPIDMNPGVPTYFRLAELKDSEIMIRLPDNQERRLGRDTVLKISVSGRDIVGRLLYLHLTVADHSIEIKPWEKKQR
jgi:hypothetical protein